jgi:hypothetical protein
VACTQAAPHLHNHLSCATSPDLPAHTHCINPHACCCAPQPHNPT